MKKPKIVVIGSINMDLVTQTNTIPKVGETVLGEDFMTAPGGKGANQAVAAAKLGGDVTLLGCVGDDAFGSELMKHLHKQGVDTKHIQTISNTSSGVAAITLSEGDNSIIVVPGANHKLTPVLVQQHEQLITDADIVLLQLEIPLDSVVKAAELARKHNVPVILNPAPMQELPKKLILQSTYLTPNEHELESLLSSTNLSQKETEALKAKSIVTRGSKGIQLQQEGVEQLISGYQVDVVDSTGAGDTFNGALALSLSSGLSLLEASQFANAAAALSVTKLGAQSGMPTKKEVESFLH
ncbi:ribokinase [Metabacillus halosaccharovorans]|uniref:Ribokinase n=1 Tax=Metabacillus halosaccharovorans TaxID=930124 RepID=A0ABT3DBM3_9BACI|nr:ribokinase [Metabacillus halosaccharovorans]MCV9884459.1 ribokinase [Metabacillus halosaccharovorans]